MRELLDRLVDQMVTGDIRFQDARDEFERRFIQRVLRDTGGHLSDAAARLGIHRNTLSRRLTELRMPTAVRAGRTRTRPK